MNEMNKGTDKKVILLIIVAALGYFVDIYDMVLFGVVKSEALVQLWRVIQLKNKLLQVNFCIICKCGGNANWRVAMGYSWR